MHFNVHDLGMHCEPSWYLDLTPTGEIGPEEEVTGVVNGLWRYDLAENKVRPEHDQRLLTEARIEELSTRYLVRVGIERSNVNPIISEYVVLPQGWKFSPVDVVNDGHTINVGDIVTLKVAKPRMVDYLTGISRKCDSTPASSERPEWQIGCVAITKFGERSGYGGKHYYLTGSF